ncbi:MAG: Type 1 glutamine amidotransferase-like domain-containing protein [Candidatus Paceibacterota bacterium]
MRLYLSSFRIGNNPNKLVELTGKGGQAVFIVNALDYKPESRGKFLVSEIQILRELGYDVEELDLRMWFGKKAEDLEKYLRTKNLVWVNGGNTFLLRRAMKQSGFDEIITRLLKEDVIVYAGFSAGCAVLHKDLHGIDITDDPNISVEGYTGEIEWAGLGIIDFNIVTHYESEHNESEEAKKEMDFYIHNKVPFKTLSDGEVLIVNNDFIEIIK